VDEVVEGSHVRCGSPPTLPPPHWQHISLWEKSESSPHSPMQISVSALTHTPTLFKEPVQHFHPEQPME
jgi:hypothetical protein